MQQCLNGINSPQARRGVAISEYGRLPKRTEEILPQDCGVLYIQILSKIRPCQATAGPSVPNITDIQDYTLPPIDAWKDARQMDSVRSFSG